MKPTAPETPASLPRASFARSNEALIWHMEYLSSVLTDLRQRALRGERLLSEARIRVAFVGPGGRPREMHRRNQSKDRCADERNGESTRDEAPVHRPPQPIREIDAS